jgi:hypothetical protein
MSDTRGPEMPVSLGCETPSRSANSACERSASHLSSHGFQGCERQGGASKHRYRRDTEEIAFLLKLFCVHAGSKRRTGHRRGDGGIVRLLRADPYIAATSQPKSKSYPDTTRKGNPRLACSV